MYLSRSASRARLREAQNARNNRAEIVRALSRGQVSRRELVKWGIFTASGTLAAINGLSPFARSAYAGGSDIPTGTPPSPLFGAPNWIRSLLSTRWRPTPTLCSYSFAAGTNKTLKP